MQLSESVKKFVETAGAKALATTGALGLNVVPVSAVAVEDDRIWLYDFFMDKTAKNLKGANDVALACWDGTCGIQIKAQVTYHTDGEQFAAAQAAMATQFPERTLKGLIELMPQEVHELSLPGSRVVVE